MKQHKKQMAWLVLVGVLLTILLNVFVSVHTTMHDGGHEDCPVCHSAAVVVKHLQKLCALASTIAIITLLVSHGVCIASATIVLLRRSTLVSQCVRLDR